MNTVLYATDLTDKHQTAPIKCEYNPDEMAELFTAQEIADLDRGAVIRKVGKYSTIVYVSATALALQALAGVR